MNADTIALDNTNAVRVDKSGPEQNHLPNKKMEADGPMQNAMLDCGWGHLYFASTWNSEQELARALQNEAPGRRDIAFYVQAPQVLLSYAPQQLFLDPSVIYRLSLTPTQTTPTSAQNFRVRPLLTRGDILAMNRLYASRQMVSVDPNLVWSRRDDDCFIYLVAEDLSSGEILGCIMGIDHVKAFADPHNGASFWCLAVDPQASMPGIGQVLVSELANQCYQRGRQYLDLSVMHDNQQAIALYEKMGFVAVTGFAVKRKNAINELLYCDPERFEHLNPYARIIINEALRRGIDAQVIDAERNIFNLAWAGREVMCQESLSELTSATALQICQDKHLTCDLLRQHQIKTPDQCLLDDMDNAIKFMCEKERVVVKPLNGEQGKGISIDVRDKKALSEAVAVAQAFDEKILIEEFCEGKDLRIVVINNEVVAAAIRKPAHIIGDGKHNAKTLIEKQSRRRQAATNGESCIPLDSETERCLAAQSFEDSPIHLNTVLPVGFEVEVRKTANLHTGGTIHDVTTSLHPELARVAVEAAKLLRIPVVGLDFLVGDHRAPDYVIIEANERPGLANHEPQPTAEKFIDLLFPSTIAV